MIDILKLYLDKYIEFLKHNEESNESYKWEAINHFKENWDIKTDDFEAMFLESFKKVSNLVYQNSWGFIKKALAHYDEIVREMFKRLYDESKPLLDRIKEFEAKTEELLELVKKAENNNNLNAQQDERTISVYLSFMYPEKYYLYKSSFYTNLCKQLNVQTKKTGSKYLHYLELAESIKNKFILKNDVILKLHKEIYPQTKWNNINLITQNFFFLIFENMNTNFDKTIPGYYCVGFHFYSQDSSNQLSKFIDNGVWQNGYDDKFQNIVNSVPVGSLLAAKTSYTMNEYEKTISVLEVHCIGKVIENHQDGKTLNVEWQKGFKPFILKGKGAYRSTISQVHNQPNIKAIFYNDNHKEEIIIAEENEMENLLFPLNQILYGPPGTGKTYKTKKIAVEIIENRNYSDSIDDRDFILEKFNEYIKNNQIYFTTFHQSMSYEDFIEGIKPKMNVDNNGEVEYEVKTGVFKQICQSAEKKETANFDKAYSKLIKDIVESEDEYLVLYTPRKKEFRVNVNSNGNLTLFTTKNINQYGTLTSERLHDFYFGAPTFSGWEGYATGILKYIESKYNLSKENKSPNQKYVLIIDEINRGNISSIFGELITLIEPDKRAESEEAIKLTLPYSKEKFSVPKNVYIIGTMNTADRSVEALDTALRRRFSFIEFVPDTKVLKNAHQTDGVITKLEEEIDLIKLLDTINGRIELLIDKDHKIGHSYFIKVLNFDDLVQTFKDNVIPLLEEYFYGDFGKIGLVLGKAFIDVAKKENKATLADFEHDDKEIFNDKKLFCFTKSDSWAPKSFQSIYNRSIKIGE
ncbi:McrB family protein [Maribacter stanieri]|uniref:McrB family protein n=1 Tax=Maribacter stanieri TaxID=440514 RepID=UPI0024957CC7|nr:AAA family ATPase [Maribacter stanieri]